ncbi:unnamed protein product [Nippostrongylus brasiliensis]|uniref:Uncharacterized protein n=1 Tax=Nippostrongylus brasiliensis TaxID=27835 RepID=A0A0N4YIN2_NIPBR|nr:unnamed protein product [Nippostrongylus brasiliensis]
MVDSSVKNFQFLLSIRNGEVEEDDGGRIDLPTESKSSGDLLDDSVKNSALWAHFRQHRLRNNMRAATSGPSWRQFLLSIQNGEVEKDDGGRIKLPTELKFSGDLLAEVFGYQITNERRRRTDRFYYRFPQQLKSGEFASPCP